MESSATRGGGVGSSAAGRGGVESSAAGEVVEASAGG